MARGTVVYDWPDLLADARHRQVVSGEATRMQTHTYSAIWNENLDRARLWKLSSCWCWHSVGFGMPPDASP